MGFSAVWRREAFPCSSLAATTTPRSGWPSAGGSWRGRASTSPPSMAARLRPSPSPTATARPFLAASLREARPCEAVFPDAGIESYTDAVRVAIENIGVDLSARNVLVTHQFVTGAATCESEELSVGGTDNVDASVFDGFDYVALGHLHGPQNFGGSRAAIVM